MSVSTRPEVLILVPGLMCDEALWQTQIEMLSPRIPVQVADHGELASIPAMATRILRSSPSRFALAGHSMGGRVALEVIRQEPQRVTHLALIDTACYAMPTGEAADKERNVRNGFLKIIQEVGIATMAQRWLLTMVHPDRLYDTSLTDAIVAMFARRSEATYTAQIHALFNRPEAFPLLSTIQCPTLVLCGDKDASTPAAGHREMASAIPNAQLMILEHCGHMSPLEQPTAVSAALGTWLTQ